MKERDIVPVLADWSTENPIIQELVNVYQNPSLTYYLIIPPEGKAIELDAVVRPAQLLEAFGEQG